MKKIYNKNLYQNFKSDYSPDDFHHIAFKTTNYKKMVDFYKNLFGCEPLYQSDLITFLAYDNEHHRIAIANTSGVLNSLDRKSTRLNSSHSQQSRMPSSA